MSVDDSKGIGIQHLRRLYQLVTAPANGIRLLIHDLVVSKFHILSREFFPVVPEDPFAKKEGDLGFWTMFQLPGFCQLSHKTVQVLIVLDQTVKDEGLNVTGGRILGKDWVQERGIADRTDDQLVHLRSRPGADEKKADPQQEEKEDRRNGKKDLDLQEVLPFGLCGSWQNGRNVLE